MEDVNIFLQDVKTAIQIDQKATYEYFNQQWASVIKALNATTIGPNHEGQPEYDVDGTAASRAPGAGFCAQMITKDECVLHPICR